MNLDRAVQAIQAQLQYEKERIKFEASTEFVGYDFSRCTDETDQDFGDYVEEGTQYAWMGWWARAKPGAASPESPLRERLTELVEFWRGKHTTGGIPWGDVADLLKEKP